MARVFVPSSAGAHHTRGAIDEHPDTHRSAIDEDPAADRHQPALCPGVCRRHPHRLHLRLLRRRMGPGPKIKQAFEKECGCTLNLVPLEDGVAILNRLRLEGQHSKADMVLGLDDAPSSARPNRAACSPPFHQAR